MDLSNNLDSLEELLSYKFSKRELLKLSLTHRSFSQENNEIYEFLGDSIINLCTSIWLMNKNKDLSEGELSSLRSKIVSRKNLGRLAKNFKLEEFVILGNSISRKKIHQTEILGNTFESIVAAIYFDSNFENTSNWLSQVFEKYSDLMDLSLEKDSKTELQELLQKRQLPLPKYLNTSPKEGLFESSIVSEQNKHFLGKGSSIKEAEKDAAENYLKHLMKDE